LAQACLPAESTSACKMRVATSAPVGPVASVGDERPMAEEGGTEFMEMEESISESMMTHKKLSGLHQGVRTLQKTSRAHHEMVVRLERAMNDTISENDLRRAIGLALEEFDSQLVEAFRDSNRKCMSMFAKSEDVSEMQGKMDKKVNFTEYNTVLQKLSELRRYVDTMAESVFIGHQESKEEFAKEVNVEKALKLKADLEELTQVRAKLERLEAVVTANDLKHSHRMDELCNQVSHSQATNIKANSAMISQNKAMIQKLEQQSIVMNTRVTVAEEQIGHLNDESKSLADKHVEMQERQDGVIWRACLTLQGLFQTLEGKVQDLSGDFTSLHANVEQFRTFCNGKIQNLCDVDEQVKEQVKFLMEASEMLKRRAREFNKNHSSQLKELSSSETKLAEQVAAIERSLKGQERELRSLEKRGPAPPMASSEPRAPADPVPVDPNDHLQGVLVQLEKIANGTPTKLPRPFGGDFRTTAEQDAALIPALAGLAGLVPHSARTQGASCTLWKGSPKGAYGLSPRLPLPSGSTGVARTQAPKKGVRS